MVDYLQSASYVAVMAGTHRFYVSVGTREGEGKTNVQKDMVPLTLQVCDALLAHGLTEHEVRLVKDEGAVHNINHFRQQFPKAVEWLLG